ncbi:helix-turn-helix domain-containing protein [Ruminococcus sp.]|uniref:helix-turn-helix domain-containing protein n=1 Tax=Ruminococcus sp. TaxID=41978 RepID=UPI003865A7BE
MTEKNVFSERLTQLREDRGLKRQEVADALEISRASLEYYEKGQRKPDIEVAARIAKYYGVSTDYLVGVSAAQVTASENETLKTVCDYLGISEASAEQVSYLTSIGYSTNMDAILSSEIIEILTTSLDDYDKKSIEKAIAYMTLSEAKTKKDKERLKEEYRQADDRLEFESYKMWNRIKRVLDTLCHYSDEEIKDILEKSSNV